MSIVHTHNIGNFGDLVHIHNLPIIQAGQAAAFGQLFSEAVRAGVCYQQVHFDLDRMNIIH